MTPEIETVYANKRWGHGKLWRLTVRLWCSVVGHRWMPWHFDWPYDDPWAWEEMGEEMRDPTDDEVLLWVRGCERECGCIETAHVTLRGAPKLPGQATGLRGNPIRQEYYE